MRTTLPGRLEGTGGGGALKPSGLAGAAMDLIILSRHPGAYLTCWLTVNAHEMKYVPHLFLLATTLTTRAGRVVAIIDCE
ncbi:hypothetical protein GCM10009628_13960 [Paeniglutamicibacter kerguelensis]